MRIGNKVLRALTAAGFIRRIDFDGPGVARANDIADIIERESGVAVLVEALGIAAVRLESGDNETVEFNANVARKCRKALAQFKGEASGA